VRRAGVALALILALTGCSTVAAPAPGLSADEKDAVRRQQTEGLWAATGLNPDHRPASPPVTVVSVQDWAPAYVACMNAAGLDNYTVAPEGGVRIVDLELAAERTALERLSDYLCRMSFEVEGQFDHRYNGAQIDYLYDYFRESLVPCLAVEGFEVSSVPTRGEFARGIGSWHPYLALRDDLRLALLSDSSFLLRCPPMPPGIDDPGYASYFG
jgi:hypothetical protein